MKLNIHSQDGSKVSSIIVDKSVFGIEPNINAVNQAVNTELANLRQGTRSSKNRSKVRGGGKKPFKQKGRGGARAGTIRSPLWKGGGTVFGPQPYNYSLKMPKKMRNLARRSVLSNHFKNNNIFVIAVIYKKRALPIYWQVFQKKGPTNLAEQKALIKSVLRLLKKSKLVVIGHREFHGVELSSRADL